MIKKVILFISIIALAHFKLNAQCTENCVWPGDANVNGIANHLDLLTLGLTWDATGPARDNPSVDWVAQDATDWADNLPVSGANFKHSDSNGDGQVPQLAGGANRPGCAVVLDATEAFDCGAAGHTIG